jgi:hypothetical protein
MELAHWHSLVALLSSRDPGVCADAASKLQSEAGVEDIPRLLELLQEDDFFVREAAAWPLAVLAGPSALPELLVAYERGFAQGHDNDGFTGALLEIPALFPTEAKAKLELLASETDERIRDHAVWLLEFIPDSGHK